MTLSAVNPQPQQQPQPQHQQQPLTIVNSSAIAQVIPGRLYFTSFSGSIPKNDAKTVYIDVDEKVHYDAFYDDFGPLNLSVLYRFCQYLNNLLETQRASRRIFLYTSMYPQSRVNAVFLIASYMIIYQNLTAEQAYLRLQSCEPPTLIGFRDAAMGPPSYLLHVQHVIQSIEKAVKFKWLDFDDFDPEEYEFFERVENGDLNWIIPGKVLSFCGPHERSYMENGYPYHSPEIYFDYFRTHNVTSIIRLNKKIYDAKRFTEAGFQHHDLFFVDGSTPSDDIVLRFIDVVDTAKGAVAIHCKAGLGRTGTLIACWMMKHFRLTAPQCMGWLRVCRPGSVIGPQQHFLIDKQNWCWRLGREEKQQQKQHQIGMAEPAAAAMEEEMEGAEDQEVGEEEEDKVESAIRKISGGGGIGGGNGPRKISGESARESARKISRESARKISAQHATSRNSSACQTDAINNNNNNTSSAEASLWTAREAMEAETKVNAEGKSQGDRLCQIKASRQQWPHNQQQQQQQNSQRPLRSSDTMPTSSPTTTSPTSSSASVLGIGPTFLLPARNKSTSRSRSGGGASGRAKKPSPTTTTTMGKDACQYSSATTPIKQLKLSTTHQQTGTGAAGRHHVNLRPTSPSTVQVLGQSPSSFHRSPGTSDLLRNLRSHTSTTTTAAAAQDLHNGNAMMREERRRSSKGMGTAASAAHKLPIQKVSVSTTYSSNNNNSHPMTAPATSSTTTSAAAHHRKHFGGSWAATEASRPIRVSSSSFGNSTSSSRLLKPYQLQMPAGGHPVFNERTAVAVNNVKSGNPASGLSATTTFGRTLNRQYARINANPGGLQPSTSSSQIHQIANRSDAEPTSPPPPSQQFHSPETNCKYELRPRSQLHVPARFTETNSSSGSGATSPGTTPGTTTLSAGQQQQHQTTTKSSGNSSGSRSNSPFALSRNQRGSRSTAAMFSSRL